MRQGLSYFHETIFYGLPAFLRRIDTALKNIGQPMLPLNHCLFRFGSWCAAGEVGMGPEQFLTRICSELWARLCPWLQDGRRPRRQPVRHAADHT